MVVNNYKKGSECMDLTIEELKIIYGMICELLNMSGLEDDEIEVLDKIETYLNKNDLK